MPTDTNEVDLLLIGAGDLLGEERAEQLADAARNLADVVPPLTEDQVEKIAASITERVWSKLEERSKLKTRRDLKSAVKSVAYQITLGVGASAIYAWLVYLANYVLLFDGEEETSEQRESRRKEAMVRNHLINRVPFESRAEVAEALANHWLREMMARRIMAAVEADEKIAAVLDELRAESSFLAEVKATSKRSWLAHDLSLDLLYELSGSLELNYFRARND